jgi:hypothetical protein
VARVKNEYLNNKRFTQALVQYKIEKTADPSVTLNSFSDSAILGEGIILICKNLGRKSNFNNYTYLGEMVNDGIENCLKAALNFDPALSSNAFGYFTKVAFNAFIRRIQKEKKQRDGQLRLLSDSAALNEIISAQFDGVGSEESLDAQVFVDQINSFLSENEKLQEVTIIERKEPKKKKYVISPLDQFINIVGEDISDETGDTEGEDA